MCYNPCFRDSKESVLVETRQHCWKMLPIETFCLISGVMFFKFYADSWFKLNRIFCHLRLCLKSDIIIQRPIEIKNQSRIVSIYFLHCDVSDSCDIRCHTYIWGGEVEFSLTLEDLFLFRVLIFNGHWKWNHQEVCSQFLVSEHKGKKRKV